MWKEGNHSACLYTAYGFPVVLATYPRSHSRRVSAAVTSTTTGVSAAGGEALKLSTAMPFPNILQDSKSASQIYSSGNLHQWESTPVGIYISCNNLVKDM